MHAKGRRLMGSTVKKLAFVTVVFVLMQGATRVEANPVGDFFKKVGQSISHLRKGTPPPKKPRRKTSQNNKEGGAPADAESTLVSPAPPTPTPTPTPTPVDIRPAALAPTAEKRRDVPYAVGVPDMPGFVTSPYAPNQGLVDVRAFPSSTEVLDPFTGKIFLTP